MDWKGITIHHSMSHDVPASEIDRWHKNNGWDGIGYHFVVRKNGSIEPGRLLNKQGAHKPASNRTHIGICFTGDFSKEVPTKEQLEAGLYLCKGLKTQFNLTHFEGHHEECPNVNFPLESFIKDIENNTNTTLDKFKIKDNSFKVETNNTYITKVELLNILEKILNITKVELLNILEKILKEL